MVRRKKYTTKKRTWLNKVGFQKGQPVIGCAVHNAAPQEKGKEDNSLLVEYYCFTTHLRCNNCVLFCFLALGTSIKIILLL